MTEHIPYGECPVSVTICPEVDCGICRGNKTMTDYHPVTKEELEQCRICSAAIRKEERERVLNDLCNLFRWTNKEGNFRPWNIGHIEQVIAEYKKSLREGVEKE